MHHNPTSSLTSFILHFCDMALLIITATLSSSRYIYIIIAQYKTVIILLPIEYTNNHHHHFYYYYISNHDGTVHMLIIPLYRRCLYSYYYYFTASILIVYCITTTHEQMWQEYSYIIILGVYIHCIVHIILYKLQSFIIVIVTHYNQLNHSTYNEKRKGCANDIVFHSIFKCITVLWRNCAIFLSPHNDICILMHLSSAVQQEQHCFSSFYFNSLILPTHRLRDLCFIAKKKARVLAVHTALEYLTL